MSRSLVKFNAQRFKEIRLEKGHTYASLARAAGMSPGTVRHWEQGRYIPSLESLAIVMDILGHSPAEVMDIPIGTATLADLRNLSLCTSQEAADALGITLGGYSNLERGYASLTDDRIAILATLFGVSELEIARAWARAK
ncbi:helix-turn-helix transcriptional regulator [Corynebacterium callunae]|uniref:Putative helix-turn-helix protein n=1 Tax=Corynebacterium callunae DSM 20147 TaxID=1121353 RepID=M1V0Y9_9CORY|nr:helix-turn-helix transcriptional regulator [Corynebacterium callunae]AGG68078.1 putative helix-turn-helix protein [Corynebacterium callunae DSM 20147]